MPSSDDSSSAQSTRSHAPDARETSFTSFSTYRTRLVKVYPRSVATNERRRKSKPPSNTYASLRVSNPGRSHCSRCSLLAPVKLQSNCIDSKPEEQIASADTHLIRASNVHKRLVARNKHKRKPPRMPCPSPSECLQDPAMTRVRIASASKRTNPWAATPGNSARRTGCIQWSWAIKS